MNKIISIFLVLLFACSSNHEMSDNSEANINQAPTKEIEESSKADIQKQVEGNSIFALNLLQKLYNDKDNLIISPFSISNAMAILYAGAKHDCAEEIQNTMHFAENSENFHAVFYGINQFLQSLNSSHTKIAHANGLWVQEDYTFLDDYLDLCKKYYGSALFSTDFKNETEKSRKKINKWVADITRNKIVELFAQGIINDLTRLVITNAIYMNAQWELPFDPEKTKDDEFTLHSGKKITTKFMNHYGEYFLYFSNDTFQCVSLPYKRNKLSMVILLPANETLMPSLIQSMNLDNLDYWMGQMTNKNVEQLAIPRFSFEAYFDLGETLQNMGILKVFTDDADLSGMTGKKDLKVSKVVHKAFIEVNEEGTEAAAATGVVAVEKSAMPEKIPTRFIADHPFIYIIKDNTHNNILFMGVLHNPK